MSLETTHIIKGHDVAATRAMRPDPSVLQRPLKISKHDVAMPDRAGDAELPVPRNRRIQAADAVLAGESFPVRTRESSSEPRAPREPDIEEPEVREPTAGELETLWKQRLEEAVAAAREEGFNAGRAAIESEMEEKLRETVTRAAQDVDAIQHAWERHLRDVQVRLVQLAFRIAGVILDAPLPADLRRISEAAITDAVESMIDGVSVEVALHPVSYLRLKESGLEDHLRAVHSKLRWRSDPSLRENEWIVQTDRAALRRLEAELLDDLQRDLSMPDVPPDVAAANTSNGGDETDRRYSEHDEPPIR
jgi:flagellar biosynthesis/type III secretory pathway protein FliH